MALAKKCDRCGIMYENYNVEKDPEKINGLITCNIDDTRHFYENNLLDFCPDCSKSFDKWLKEFKHKE